MKNSKLRVANGSSLLYGNNYGPFPKRSFYNFSSLGRMRPDCPLSILSCGIDQWHKEVFRERINSDTFSVELVTDGIFSYTLDGKSYQVNPGELFFVQLGMNSSMRCETETATKQVVIFEGSLIRHTLEYLGIDRIAVLVPRDLKRITDIFDNLINLGKVSNFENFRNACSECYRLLLEISAQNIVANRPDGLQRAIEFIYENLENNVSLNDIVAYSRISGATLHRQFRKYLSVSPVEYYLNAKMELAHNLLRCGNLSIKEISSRLNYSSPQYFANEFKKRYGKTPSQVK